MNGLGMEVTKHASAANRVTLTQIRTVIIWLFFLIFPLIFDLRVSESFQFLQLGGFIIILIGVVIYNEVVTIPFFGLDKNCKKNRSYANLRTSSSKNKGFGTDVTEEDEALYDRQGSIDSDSEYSGDGYARTTSKNYGYIKSRQRSVGRQSEYFAMTNDD
mmetsp:Transcript_15363/g.15241  ORF Transcript_15363/g.15241 Transcript_15363/m.15241 type:complete len:160 (-) Transcript_15363:17-496(-)